MDILLEYRHTQLRAAASENKALKVTFTLASNFGEIKLWCSIFRKRKNDCFCYCLFKRRSCKSYQRQRLITETCNFSFLQNNAKNPFLVELWMMDYHREMLNFENDWRQFEQVDFMKMICCYGWRWKIYFNFKLRFYLIVPIKCSIEDETMLKPWLLKIINRSYLFILACYVAHKAVPSILDRYQSMIERQDQTIRKRFPSSHSIQCIEIVDSFITVPFWVYRAQAYSSLHSITKSLRW